MNDVDKAERYGWQRAVILGLFGSTLLFGLVPALRGTTAMEGDTAFGIPIYLLRILITVAGALLIATGGSVLRRSPVVVLANDESTRDHRRRSLAIGFWTMLLIAVGCYIASFLADILSARLTARLIVDGGEATALLAFAWLEAVAHRSE